MLQSYRNINTLILFIIINFTIVEGSRLLSHDRFHFKLHHHHHNHLQPHQSFLLLMTKLFNDAHTSYKIHQSTWNFHLSIYITERNSHKSLQKMVHMTIVKIFSMLTRELFDNSITNSGSVTDEEFHISIKLHDN